MIRAPLAFLRRAPTLALLTRHIGHPVGMLVAANSDASPALSHCLTCAESWHGGWVSGPCGWSGCQLGDNARRDGSEPLSPVEPAVLHTRGDTL